LLRIHILNVGHGDSIVLEYIDETGAKSFAVVDSNCKVGAEPPALGLLKSLGAQALSFVAITHPHADHYMGMRAILSHFSKRIDSLYTFPIRRDQAFLKLVIEAYKRYATSTDNKTLQHKLVELAHVLHLAPTAAANWEDPAGTKTILPARGFTDVEISTILPPAHVRGEFFQKIVDGSIEPERENLNDLSMAILIEYADQQVILGGDGTYRKWHYQSNRWKSGNIRLSPIAVKLPHHGSKHDCSSTVLDLLFGNRNSQKPDSVACISANGRSHPAPEVLKELVARGIKPYCTNLSKRCGSTRAVEITGNQTEPVLLRLIAAALFDEDATQPCQGNIVLELTPGKALTVRTEIQNLCPLRGDYAFLSGPLQ